MEPPRQVVPAGWSPARLQGVALLRTVRELGARHAPIVQNAALLAAAAVAVLSRGDVIVLGVLLVIGTLDLVAGPTALLATSAVVVRLGTTSLAAIAGAQSVLGPAGASAPAMGALAAWLGALALVLAAPSERAAPAFGLAAAVIVNGPGATSVGAFVVRVLAMVAFVDLTLAAVRWAPRSVTRPAAVLAGAASLLAAFVAAPSGGLHVGIRLAAVPEAVALMAVGIGILLLIPVLEPHLGRLRHLQYTPVHRRQPSGAGREGELQ